MKAIVPVKKVSTRVPNKNFRPFYDGLSLFDLKMQSLLKAIDTTDVYVSGDSEDIKTYADKYGVNFILRDAYYAKNETPMADVITHLVERLPSGDDDILWVHVTEPFFEDFSKCIEIWDSVKVEYDSLVVVKPFQGYMLNQHGEPMNFGFGHWHKRSQILPKWYIMPFSLHILSKKTAMKYSYYVGHKPYLYEFDNIAFDIDSELDFEQARAIYKATREFNDKLEV